MIDGNGVFRTRQGYTVTPNKIARDSHLSMDAKGLYLIIAAWTTHDNLYCSKDFFRKESHVKLNVFDKAWRELIAAGLIKEFVKGKIVSCELGSQDESRTQIQELKVML